MRSTRTVSSGLVVVAGVLGAFGVPSAAAQRSHPVVARAGSPPPSPSPLTTPYPGATVTVDPRWYGVQSPLQQSFPHRRGVRKGLRGGSGYYAGPPVYSYSPYYSQYSGVNDVNGQPLASYFDGSSSGGAAPMGDPDLRGAPYVVVDGGAMFVDFGNGDRRTVPACAAISAMQTPDGRPRTVFYNSAADGVVLRSGSRGRVLGSPTAGARVCYAADQYGRMVLEY